jgi:nucleotide-binding universal stress UspA family protein
MSFPIIVPLDGSPLAAGALPHAAAVARRLGAPLQLVRVLEPLSPAYETGGGARPLDRTLDRELAAMAEHDLAQAAEAVGREGVDAVPVILHGEVVPTLTQHVEEVRARLVVMTTHGRTGWRRAMMGSVTDALLRRVDSAVYAIPAPEGTVIPVPPAPVPVLLPLDGTERDDSALDLADLARATLDAQLTLLHVVQPVVDRSRLPVQQVDRVDLRERRADASAYLDRVAALLGAPTTPVAHEVVMDEEPLEGILRFAALREISHLALVTKGQRGVGKWIIGSMADRLLRDGRMALLLVRATY